MQKYTGSPSGSGNPPGKHSGSYTSMPSQKSGHFMEESSFKGDMHVSVPGKPTEVGNQPKESSSKEVDSMANGPALR